MILKTWTTSLAVLAMLGLSNCNKKSSDDTADGSSSKASAEDPESSNPLAAAFPDSLAINIFPTESTSLALEDSTIDTKPPKEMIEENKKILAGEGECFDRDMMKMNAKEASETCYEFDSDMNPSTFADRPGKSWGTTNGKNSKDEACLVAFTRQTANKSIHLVKKALGMVRGMICQAKKRGEVELPEVGESVDLAASMKEAAGSGMPVTEAKVEASEGAALVADGDNIAYQSTIKMKDPSGNAMEVYMTNQKTDDGEVGVLSFLRPAKAGGIQQGDSNNTAEKNELLSIAYEFGKVDGEPHAKLDLRRGALLKTADPFTDDGMVNYEAASESDGNAAIHMINYVAFDMNPETSEGKFAYWMNPGGNFNEPARGFVFKVEENDDGKLEGCGITGAVANTSIRKALKNGTTLIPDKFWHPRASQNTSANKDPAYNAGEGNQVTKQCFEQTSDGSYDVTTSATRGYELVTTAASGVSAPSKVEAKLPPPPPGAKK